MPCRLPEFSPLVTDSRYCLVTTFRRGGNRLSVACAGDERCRPEYRVEREGFAAFALEFVAEGEGTLALGGGRHRLRAGNAFLYGPRVGHVIASDPRRPLRKYFVDFFGREAAALLRRLRFHPGDLRRVEDPHVAQGLFDELIREGRRGGPRSLDVTECYLRLLLHKCAETPAAADARQPGAYLTWRRCERTLDERFRELKGLRELSLSTGLNASHLCRLYHQFGRRSPHAELSYRKITHAATLLVTTPLSVKEIAAGVGYADPLHFSRVFRRHFGRGPAAFRTDFPGDHGPGTCTIVPRSRSVGPRDPSAVATRSTARAPRAR